MDGDPDGTDEPVISLAGAVLGEEALDGLLQRIVQLARLTIPGAHSVSITVAHDGGYRTSNSTGPEALAVDQAQYAEDDGPCLEGIRTGEQREATMEMLQRRWPPVAERAAEVGVVGVLSTPLIVEDRGAIGALNVYLAQDGAFGERDVHLARVLGEHAAILLERAVALMSATRLNEQLHQALASREIIGQAKGILMERQSCTRDEAFDILRRASQRENRKLRDLAEELVLRVEARKREGVGQ